MLLVKCIVFFSLPLKLNLYSFVNVGKSLRELSRQRGGLTQGSTDALPDATARLPVCPFVSPSDKLSNN